MVINMVHDREARGKRERAWHARKKSNDKARDETTSLAGMYARASRLRSMHQHRIRCNELVLLVRSFALSALCICRARLIHSPPMLFTPGTVPGTYLIPGVLDSWCDIKQLLYSYYSE